MPPTERLTAALAGVAVGAASMVVCGSASSIFVSTQNSSAPAASDGEQEITRSDSATAPTLEDVGKLRQLYQQDGYVKLSGLLSTDEVESWRKAVDNGVREQLLRSQGRYHSGGTNEAVDVASGDYANQGDDAGYYRTVFVQCVNMWKKNPAIKALLFDSLAPRLRSLVGQIVGCDTGYKLYHDHCLIKQPWGSPTNWHTDQQMDPYWDPRATMLWVSLDTADATNGALCFLPGTQREAQREAPTGIDEGFGDEGIGAMLLARPEWAAIDPVCVHTQPGDALLIDPMVAHAAGANMTNKRRRAYAFLLMPAGARYNGQPAALPAHLASRLERGEEIADDEHLPPF